MIAHTIIIALAAYALAYHITSGTEAGSEVKTTEDCGCSRSEWNSYHGEHDGSTGPLWIFAFFRHVILFDHEGLIESEWWANPQSKRRNLLLHLRDGFTCPYCVSFTLSVIIAAIAQPDSWFLVGLAAAGLNVIALSIADGFD